MLISRPVHAKIQWLLDTVSRGPIIRLEVIIMLAYGFISRGRV